MSREGARPRGPALLASVLLAALLSACGSDPQPSRSAENPFSGTPSEGSILLHQAAPPVTTTTKKVRAKPITISITTQEAKGKQADDPIRLSADTIPEEGAPGRPTEAGVRRRIFQASAKSGYVVSSQRFQELWSYLDGIGVFRLKRHRGGIPADDTNYMVLSAQGKSVVLLRPDPLAGEGGPDEVRAQQATWTSAKLAIFNFHP